MATLKLCVYMLCKATVLGTQPHFTISHPRAEKELKRSCGAAPHREGQLGESHFKVGPSHNQQRGDIPALSTS